MKTLAEKEKLQSFALIFMCLSIPMAFILHSIWPSLINHGFMFGRDAGGHLLRANYWARELLLHGHLSGWFPLWYGGFNLYQVYPVLAYYPLGILSLIIEPQLALRIVSGLLWLGLIPTSYFFLKKFGFKPIQAAVAASLFIYLNSELGVGPIAVYREGLLPNSLGFIFAILFLGILKEQLSDASRKIRGTVISGVVLAGVILSHPFCAYWIVLVSLLLLLTEIVSKNRPGFFALLTRFATIFFIGLVLSAYWWVSFSLNLSETVNTEPFSTSPIQDVMDRMLAMKNNGDWTPLILAGVGIIYLVRIRVWNLLLFFVLTGALSLTLSLGIKIPLLPFGEIVSSSQRVRFEGFYFWTVWALAAYSIPAVWHMTRSIVWSRFGSVLRAGFSLFILIILPILNGSLRNAYMYPYSNTSIDKLNDLGFFLEQELKPGEFVLTEDNWYGIPTYGTPHFLHHNLAMISEKVWDLSGGLPEGTASCRLTDSIAQRLDAPGFVNNKMDFFQKRGVRYIVTMQARTCQVLQKIPWLRWVWVGQGSGNTKNLSPQSLTGDYLALFEIRNYHSRFGFSKELASAVSDVSYVPPGRYRVDLKKPASIPKGSSLAVTYHPWFHLYGDGKEIPIGPGEYYQIQFSQDVAQVNRLDLSFEEPFLSRLAGWVSAAGGVACLIYLVLGFIPALWKK